MLSGDRIVSPHARLDRRPQEKGETVARRRFQKGSVRQRSNVWIGRFLEDVVEHGIVRRKHRTVLLCPVRTSDGRAVTERQALRLLQPYLDKVNSATYQPEQVKKTIFFAEFAARWEADILSQKKPSTQMSARVHLKNYLLPALAGREVRAIQTEDIQHLLSRLNGRVSPKTIRNIKMTISTMWQIARSWGYTECDVVSNLVLPRITRTKSPFFTVEQMGRIIANVQEPLATFFWLVAETGLRAGEICALLKRDVDLGNRLLSVERSVWNGKFQSTKTENSVRTIALSPELTERLSKHPEGKTQKNSELLFPSKAGTPLRPNLLLKRKLHPLLERLGIPRCGFHAFRHGNATLLGRIGAPLKVIQHRLGHASMDNITMDVYTHFETGEDLEIAARLGGILSKEFTNSLPLTCPLADGRKHAKRGNLVFAA